jgi:hypothetical protein
MVRPIASDKNKAIALTFAASVTQFTHDTEDTVARCGRCGLFSALRKVYPQSVRDEHSGARDGISEMELNKTLQVVTRLLLANLYSDEKVLIRI